MRNKEVELTETQASRVARFSDRLYRASESGQALTLHYRKRDGSKSQSTGIVAKFLGEQSNLSVMVDTAGYDNKGPRTINIGGIVRIYNTSTQEVTE